MPDFHIQPMTLSELDFAIEQAGREGWNPGLHDASCFHAADPQGFLVGLLDGKPIGCISAMSYEGRFGFLGFYIVVPEQRGKGYGIRLWQAAMQKLAGSNVGLDGVVDQQDNYRKSGFQLAYRNIRFESTSREKTLADTPANLQAIRTVNFDDLCRYEQDYFPAARPAFLRAWLNQPDATGYAWVANGKIRGWGLIRKCRKGYKIGPLCADHAEIAEALHAALVGQTPMHEPVYIDVPEVNAEAMALANRHGMNKVFETARMYTGQAPKLSLNRLYAVTSFELG